MAVAVTRVAFEPDRIAPDGAQLVITGRWFGVRGRRFVRPTLTCETSDGPRRLLADLEHKPWAAQDGDSWTAAFPWESGLELTGAAELSVAPDITVPLGADAPKRAGTQRARRGRGPIPAETSALRERAERLQRQLEAERVRHGEARQEVERAEHDRVAVDAALARRDSALERLQRTEAELAEARAERDAALHGQRRSDAERAAALERLRETMAEREMTGRRLQATERRREQVEQQLAATHRQLTQVRHDLDEARSTVVPPTDTPAAAIIPAAATIPVRPRPLPRTAYSHDRARDIQRAIALAVLVAALIALAIILHVV